MLDVSHPPQSHSAPELPHLGLIQRAAMGVERVVETCVEFVASALLLAEVVTLFAGVVSRYVFHSPILWTDEVASMLFLWLAMLGAVVAYRRSEHMRMTAFVNSGPFARKQFFNALALTVSVVFLCLVLGPAIDFASEERFITMPTLGISNVFRAAGLPLGLGLMLLFGVLRLLDFAHRKSEVAAIVVTAVVGGSLYAVSALLPGLGNLNLLLFFVGVVGILVFSSVPIAFAFGIATVAYIGLTTDLPQLILIGRMDEGMSHLILLAVPLFVFLGLLIEMTGMAKAMVGFLASLLGHVRGGLDYVLIAAMYLVSGISGAKAADMAAVAPVLFPEMKRRGADDGELVALLAATGAQTETVPPSIVLITIGSVTGVSISALFTGGLLPAAVLGAALCGLVWWRRRSSDMSQATRSTKKAIFQAFIFAFPALLLPFVIRFAVISGIATATEVSTIGIAYTAVIGIVVYRHFPLARIRPLLVETVSLSGAILLIVGTATGMAWSLTQSGFSGDLAAFMKGLPGGASTFLVMSAIAFVVLGSVLEGIPAIVLFGPLFFPIAAQLGINEVHYAMVVVIAMGIGLFAPPFGVGYYAACAISRVHPNEGMKPMVLYISALLIGLVLIVAFPSISTCLL